MDDVSADPGPDQTLFVLPSLGSDMESGTIIEWLVEPGDIVHRGDVLLRVDTEKSDIDVETWDDGIVVALLASPGTEVPVGAPLAHLAPITDSTETLSPSPAAPNPSITQASVDQSQAIATPSAVPPHSAPIAASPPRAQVAVIGPRTVFWPSPKQAIEAPRQEPAISKPDRMRGAIARVMTAANRDIPHYHVMQELDVTTAIEWLTVHNEGRPATERIVLAALLTKATAQACEQHPELNGYWKHNRFVPADTIRVGIAVHLRSGGLVIPAMEMPQTKSLAGVMEELVEITRRARADDLRSSDVTPATITITNLGDRGADAVLGIINPPQVALVGYGGVRSTLARIGTEIIDRSAVTATLSADHRATDGHAGSRFLQAINAQLQHPEEL